MRKSSLRKIREKITAFSHPYLPVIYALLLEAVEFSLFAFALVLTAEAILPGIVTFRMNLAKPLIVIILMIALAGFLGRHLGASFPLSPDKKNPLAWIGITWFAFLLTLASIGFPSWVVPIIIGGIFGIAYLFWKIFFRRD
ncbi:MAG: hypothetical protein KBD19_00335 [Candidatus Moranbacteria bacterium]|nr:hypothetical protein [Candidatus Moranbacteria bacterium]